MLGIHSGQSLRIHLLGPELRLIFVGSSITASAAPKTRELLAYLILRARDPISRDGVASMLWPDVLDSEGRSNLRRHLSLLQRYLAPYVDEAAVLIENDSLRWNETAAWVDVYAFERLSTAPGAASAAIELYVADLLSRSDAEWLESERERLRTAAFNLLTKSMDAAERFDDVTRADRYACEMLRIDPFREEAIRRRMNYSARSGDRSAALKIFNDFERRLRDELGAEPMSQTRALRDLLASGQEMGSRSASPVRDDLVGRARELEQIAGLLALRRLVTVAGAGGMGKTRVAERLVRDLAADFADGAVSVKLDALPPGSSVLDSIAAEVDVPQSRDDAMIRALVAFFGTKHVLLALDGCERDLPGVRLVAEALSRACPNLRILATSREPLRATGEAVFTLPPLSGIGAGAGGSGILDSDAATLFLMRARAAAPIPDLGAREIEALVDICARLDGIPLAIEIAASRCRVMTIVEIARRLDDAALVIDFARTGESRHRRTLRDIIAWAYDALEAEQRAALRLLALFRAPVTLDDVSRLLSGATALSAIDLTTSFVDCSLLIVEYGQSEVRYRFLEPIRDFVLEMVARESEALVTLERHIAFHTANASALSLPSGGVEPGQTFDSLEAHRLNVEAALRFALDTNTIDDAAIDLALSMRTFWRERGYVREAYEIFKGFCEAIHPESERHVMVLTELADFARLAGRHAESRECAERARVHARERADRFGAASASFVLGALAYTIGDNDRARVEFTDAREGFEAIGRATDAARAIVDLALLDTIEGIAERARRLLLEAIACFSSAGELRMEMFATSALGSTERVFGNYAEAKTCSAAALRYAQKAGDRVLATACLANLCVVALALGDEEGLRAGVREGLLGTRSGSFPFSLVAFFEVSCRYLMSREAYEDAARLSMILRLLLDRYAVSVANNDAEVIGARFEKLRLHLGGHKLEEFASTYEGASTEQCVDVALEAMRAITSQVETASVIGSRASDLESIHTGAS